MATRTARGSRKYYQGWVHVKHRDVYRRLFAQLRAGKELRFYVDDTRAMGAGGPCEFSVDLSGLKDISLKSDRRFSNQHPEYLIILKFRPDRSQEKELKLRHGSSDEREAWVRYLRAVGLKQLPERTNHLLPGQIHELNDIIEHEQTNEDNGEYLVMSPNVEEPWFYPNLTDRYDAEEMLKLTKQGNMLVRARLTDKQTDDYDFAVSVKSSDTEFRHYKMKKLSPSGEYLVFLSEAPNLTLQTLEDVMAYFEKRSNGKYKRCQQKISSYPHIYEETMAQTDGLYVNEHITATSEYYNLQHAPPLKQRNGNA